MTGYAQTIQISIFNFKMSVVCVRKLNLFSSAFLLKPGSTWNPMIMNSSIQIFLMCSVKIEIPLKHDAPEVAAFQLLCGVSCVALLFVSRTRILCSINSVYLSLVLRRQFSRQYHTYPQASVLIYIKRMWTILPTYTRSWKMTSIYVF